jgi:beta-mannosidase
MLSRATTAEVTERTIDEWRRPGSTNRGALLWLWKDFRDGAGWGITDAAGRPKSTWFAVKRAFAPLRLSLSDEGVNGLMLHLVNDRPEAVAGTLVIECLKDGGRAVVTGRRGVELGGHDSLSVSAFELFGAFFDAGYAYRFGPPAHDLVVARLEGADGETLAEAFHVLEPARIGRHNGDIAATVEQIGQHWRLTLSAERAALFVQIQDEAFAPSDNWFHLAPGRPRQVTLMRLPDADEAAKPKGTIQAVTLAGQRSFKAA